MISTPVYNPSEAPLHVADDYDEYGVLAGRPLPPKEFLPTMHDLPSEEIEQIDMRDTFHVWQGSLLDETCRPPNYEQEEVFSAIDLNIYYSPGDSGWNKRPVWFAVVGLPKGQKSEMRMSYAAWQEEMPPLIVVELLSPGVEKEDLGQTQRVASRPPTKWQVYEQWLGIPYHVIFNRYDDQMRVFRLSGEGYEEVLDHQGRLWIEKIELGLGLWQGSFMREERLWLRWYDRNGNWLPANNELAEQAQQRAEELQQEKDAALRKAEQLAAKLRELGIDLDRL